MYLKHFGTKYYGPLGACDFELSFSDNGEPIPTVLVGANGSGKSLLLSIVLDAYVTMRCCIDPAWFDSEAFRSE